MYITTLTQLHTRVRSSGWFPHLTRHHVHFFTQVNADPVSSAWESDSPSQSDDDSGSEWVVSRSTTPSSKQSNDGLDTEVPTSGGKAKKQAAIPAPRGRSRLRTETNEFRRRRRTKKMRHRYTLETKARALAFYDTLSETIAVADREDQTIEKFRVLSVANLQKWKSAEFRAKLERALGCLISQFAPRAKGAPRRNKGGRGKRATGRKHARIQMRRAPKFYFAEEQTYKWFLRQRKKGLAVGSRAIRNKMLRSVRDHEYDNAEGFRASAGWFRRFFARYHLSWRRKNDNASKSVDELLPTVVTFINNVTCECFESTTWATLRLPLTRANSANSARATHTT